MLDQQVDDARRALVQQILAALPPRLPTVGYDERSAPSWAKSANYFASKLSRALAIPPTQDVSSACAWYRSGIEVTRALALQAKIERDRLMFAMLGGNPGALQPVSVDTCLAGIDSAAGAGQIASYLDPGQLQVVGLWRLWMRERDSLNAIRDQAQALDLHGEAAWEKVSGRPFPDPHLYPKVRDAILGRWA